MITDTCWTPITTVDKIPLHEGRAVTVNGIEIAIFHLEKRYLTIQNKCPHKGGPLCDGIVAGTAVVCPLHGRRFDLETGMAVRASEPSSVATYPTRVEDGVILVDLTSEDEVTA
ncbi:MAG: nitrite reductase small subunit NirD [Bryobacterales bacterium]|nr:nitrite reductase small subunit NirD [Bryobacterales bacterium]